MARRKRRTQAASGPTATDRAMPALRALRALLLGAPGLRAEAAGSPRQADMGDRAARRGNRF